MSKRIKIISLILLSFVFTACFCLSRMQQQTVLIQFVEGGDSELSVTAQIQSEDSLISVNAFRSDSGNYYLFLPSCTQGKLLAVGEGVSEDMTIVESGMTLAVNEEYTLTILTGSEIPSVFLTLKNDLSYISSDKAFSDSGQAVILDQDGKSVYDGRLNRIKGRGNTSWEQEKKPFNIRLEKTVELPGTGAADTDFSLVTSTDMTFLRNRISNKMSEVMGGPYVKGTCVNLYINNSFEGVYEIYQKISPDSMDIWDLEAETKQLNQYQDLLSQQTTGMTLDNWNQSVTGKWWDYEKNPDNITGGYILEIDHPARYADEPGGFTLGSGACVVAKSPSYLSEAQYQYISAYMQDCENAMFSGVGKEDYRELSQYIDVSSFVVKYLVEEISKNIDCSSTSQYFYKDQDGVLYAGPAWDYDWAYGVGRVQEEIDYLDPEGFSAREIPGALIWWQLLYYNNGFYHNLVDTYEEVLYPYLNQLTQTELSCWEQDMAESAIMDYLRWGRCDSLDLKEIRNAYHGQVKMVSDFLSVRKEFLYREWIEE